MLQSLYDNEIMWKHLRVPGLFSSGKLMKPLDKLKFDSEPTAL